MVTDVTDIVNSLCQRTDTRYCGRYSRGMIEFGRHVRRRRERLRFSQAEVAGAVGKSRPWLVALEQGKGNPPAEAITALAIALSDDPKDYLRRAGRVALTAEDLVPARGGCGDLRHGRGAERHRRRCDHADMRGVTDAG